MWRLAVVIALLSSSIVAAPATTQSSADIESLIHELSGDSWKARQRAQDALVTIGPDARARLQELVHETPNDEVRTRAEAALQQIAENEETGTSLITLDASDLASKSAFAEIARQAHTDLEPAIPEFWDQMRDSRTSIHVTQQPFWSVMREMAEKTGIELSQWNEGLKLVQTGGNGPTRGIACVSGPYLIIANSVNRSESIDLNQLHAPARNVADVPPTERSFAVQLTAFAEPKLHVLQAASSAMLEVAVDNKGNSLLPPAAPGDAAPSMTGITSTWSMTAALEYPGPQIGTRIKRLKGKVNVVLQTKFQSLEVKNILSAHNIRRAVGATQIVFKGMTKNGEQYELSASATLPDSSHQDEWTRLQAIFSARNVKLFDAKGVVWNFAGAGINGGNNGVEVTMTFSNDGHVTPTPGEPNRLVVQVPTESKEVAVPFEFSDLPIP